MEGIDSRHRYFRQKNLTWGKSSSPLVGARFGYESERKNVVFLFFFVIVFRDILFMRKTFGVFEG